MALAKCLILILAIVEVLSGNEDYYWRQYTGIIPKDGVKAGKDINGEHIYVGQAYAKDQGLIVVQLQPGVRKVLIPVDGVKTVDKYIKILCGPQQNFYWMPANASHLHLLVADSHAVIGGHEDGVGALNVGRVNYEGEFKVGKVLAGFTGDSKFYFSDSDRERETNDYEVLMYKENQLDVRGAF